MALAALGLAAKPPAPSRLALMKGSNTMTPATATIAMNVATFGAFLILGILIFSIWFAGWSLRKKEKRYFEFEYHGKE